MEQETTIGTAFQILRIISNTIEKKDIKKLSEKDELNTILASYFLSLEKRNVAS